MLAIKNVIPPTTYRKQKLHRLCTHVYARSFPYGVRGYNETQLPTFPPSPELEITQDVMLVLQIPRKITPKNNLDNVLGYCKATRLHEERTNTKKVVRLFSHPRWAASEESLISMGERTLIFRRATHWI